MANQESKLTNAQLKNLFKGLNEWFSLDELKTICFHIDIEFDDLPGENTKESKTRELLKNLKRNQDFSKLIDYCSEERPKFNWHYDDSSSSIVSHSKTNNNKNGESAIDLLKKYAESIYNRPDKITIAGLSEIPSITKNKFTLTDLYIPLRLDFIKSENDQLAGPSFGSRKDSKEEEKKERQTIGQILNEYRQVVIQGKPGSGKSTLINWIIKALLIRWLQFRENHSPIPDMEALPAHSWLPLIIRCRELPKASHKWPFKKLFYYALEQLELGLPLEPLCNKVLEEFETGRVLLIIDGIDEIDSKWRRNFCERLKKLMELGKYDQSNILITSRRVGYEEVQTYLGRKYQFTSISPLTKEDKEEFINRLSSITLESKEQQAKMKRNLLNVINRLKSNELTDTFHFLGVLTVVALNREGELPQKRSLLYNLYINNLLEWNAHHHPSTYEGGIPFQQKHSVYAMLESLAYMMCEKDIWEQNRQDIVKQLHHNWKDEYKRREIDIFFDAIVQQTNLLVRARYEVKNGFEIPIYEFNHPLIQAYLAGRYFIDGYFHMNNKQQSVTEWVAYVSGQTVEIDIDISSWIQMTESVVASKWHEPLKHCTAACDDIEAVLLSILHVQDNEDASVMSRPRAVMAVHCLVEASESIQQHTLKKSAREIIKTLVDQIQRGDGFNTVKPQTSLDNAIMALKTSSWKDTLQEVIIEKLTSPQLVDLARQDIGEILLLAEEIPDKKNNAQEWEAWLNGLLEDLHHSDEKFVIRALILIMNEAFNDRLPLDLNIHNLLFKLLSRSNAIANSSLWTLNWIIRKYRDNDLNWHPTEEQLQTLTIFLENPNSDKSIIIYTLWILPDILKAAPLQQWSIIGGKIIPVNSTSLHQNKFIDSNLINIISFWLNDTEQRIRSRAVLTIGRLGVADIRMVNALLEILDHQKVSDLEWEETIQFLGCFNTEHVGKELIKRLASNDQKINRAAQCALLGLDKEAVGQLLIQNLDNAKTQQKREILKILGFLRDSRTLPYIQALKDAPLFRSDAQKAILRINGELKRPHWLLSHILPIYNGDDMLVVGYLEGKTAANESAFIYFTLLLDEMLAYLVLLEKGILIDPSEINSTSIQEMSMGEPGIDIQNKMRKGYRFTHAQLTIEALKKVSKRVRSIRGIDKKEYVKAGGQKTFLIKKENYFRIGSAAMRLTAHNVEIFKSLATQVNEMYDPDQSKNQIKIVDNMGRPITLPTTDEDAA